MFGTQVAVKVSNESMLRIHIIKIKNVFTNGMANINIPAHVHADMPV